MRRVLLPANVGRQVHFRAGQVHVQVPDGLAFSEFRGYEVWKTIAVSQTRDLIEVILGNPTITDAYRAGVWQRQAFPRRLQDGEDPLEREEERGGPGSDAGARHPA